MNIYAVLFGAVWLALFCGVTCGGSGALLSGFFFKRDFIRRRDLFKYAKENRPFGRLSGVGVLFTEQIFAAGFHRGEAFSAFFRGIQRGEDGGAVSVCHGRGLGAAGGCVKISIPLFVHTAFMRGLWAFRGGQRFRGCVGVAAGGSGDALGLSDAGGGLSCGGK